MRVLCLTKSQLRLRTNVINHTVNVVYIHEYIHTYMSAIIMFSFINIKTAADNVIKRPTELTEPITAHMQGQCKLHFHVSVCVCVAGAYICICVYFLR